MAMRKGSTKMKTKGKARKARAADKSMRTCAAEADRVVAAFRTKIEQIIYDWVCDNFDQQEARAPSWNIRELANAVADGIVLGHKPVNKIHYEE